MAATLIATNTPVATSNLIQQQTGLRISIPDPNDPVEQAFAEQGGGQSDVKVSACYACTKLET